MTVAVETNPPTLVETNAVAMSAPVAVAEAAGGAGGSGFGSLMEELAGRLGVRLAGK